jgi:phospholipid/cholesterol/gamma-HCH transport system substrate-binding protein
MFLSCRTYTLGAMEDLGAPGSYMTLAEGVPVYSREGQRIGQVSSIEFIPPDAKVEGNNLVIRLAISERVRDQIRADSRAFLRTEGLLGDKFVDIAPGSPGLAPVAAGDTLVAGETTGVDQLMDQAGTAIDSLLLIVGSVRTIADGIARGEGTLGRLLVEDQLYLDLVATTASVQATLAELNRADGTFGRLLRDPELYESVNRAVARLDSVGGLMLHGDGTVGQLLRSDTLHRNLLATVARADTAVASIAGFLAGMTEGDGTLQRLFTDPQLYDEVLKAIVDVQNLIAAIRQDPERFRPDVRVRVF